MDDPRAAEATNLIHSTLRCTSRKQQQPLNTAPSTGREIPAVPGPIVPRGRAGTRNPSNHRDLGTKSTDAAVPPGALCLLSSLKFGESVFVYQFICLTMKREGGALINFPLAPLLLPEVFLHK